MKQYIKSATNTDDELFDYMFDNVDNLKEQAKIAFDSIMQNLSGLEDDISDAKKSDEELPWDWYENTVDNTLEYIASELEDVSSVNDATHRQINKQVEDYM